MGRFDAELYLRLAGEEMILGLGPQRRRPWDSSLLDPAGALVAAGAISAARARAVIDDYTLAEALGTDQGHHLHHRIALSHASRFRRRKSKALSPRRVVPCDRTIEDANGTLHVRQVTLSEDSTSLAITWRPKPSGHGRSRRRGHMMMFGHGPTGPLSRQLSDDRGTNVGTGFSGGGSDEEWEGHLTADQPLAPDTAWIEIDGARIEFTGEALQCEVAIETLPEEHVAHRYLWRRLAVPDHFHEPPEIEASIDALVAAGALEPDDPVVGEIRAVREAMPGHPGMHSGASRGIRRLPEPWRSLLSRGGREDGPERTIALSAVTPRFDGFSVAVSCLESRPNAFAIDVEVAPGLEGRGPFRTSLVGTQLAWWAADDRGNHYLGQIGSWSGGEDYSTGEIGFLPALHPKARRLQIMPTAETTRAVISLPLSWAAEGSPGAGERT